MQRSEITSFRRTVRQHYKKHGRMFPWRETSDPYRILVSEVMLQQTQTSRVIEKYRAFLKRFPTVRALAHAPLRDVLILWQGLGYNRRAKLLHEAARVMATVHGGRFPKTLESLRSLPGVGPYTAAAVAAFAFNVPVVMLETNIRTVYLHHFFGDRSGVRDTEILPLVEATLDRRNPREWYCALMDYGAALKRAGVRNNSQSAHYVRQSRFEGSDRQIRGAILRALSGGGQTTAALCKLLGADRDRINFQICALQKEGFIVREKRGWQLA